MCLVDGDSILLVEHLKAGRRHWLLPGGGVEEGETLVEAVRREVQEETGLTAEAHRLVLLCEVIEPRGRHLLNVVFAGATTGGNLEAGRDGTLDAVGWRHRDELATLDMHPPIASEILGCWAEGFAGPVRVLGNVWRPDP
jgi:8-oxo-dGTP diphosphatase